MAEVNYGLALGVKTPEPVAQNFDLGKTLSTYASLQMSQAHANLYSLEAAKQAMTIGGLKDYQSRLASGQPAEKAVDALSFNPELQQQALTAAKTNRNMLGDAAYHKSQNTADIYDPEEQARIRQQNAATGLDAAKTTGENLANTGKRMGLVAQTAQSMPGLVSSLPTSQPQRDPFNQPQAPQQEDPQVVAARASIAGGVQNNLATGTVQPGQANAAWSHAIDGMLRNGLITPQQAEQWRQEGYSPARIKQLMGQGLTPEQFQVSSGANKLAEGRAQNTVTAESQSQGLPQEAERQKLLAETNATADRLQRGQVQEAARQTAQGTAGVRLNTEGDIAGDVALKQGLAKNAVELAALDAGIPKERARQLGLGSGEAANATEEAAVRANLYKRKTEQTAGAAQDAETKAKADRLAQGQPGETARQESAARLPAEAALKVLDKKLDITATQGGTFDAAQTAGDVYNSVSGAVGQGAAPQAAGVDPKAEQGVVNNAIQRAAGLKQGPNRDAVLHTMLANGLVAGTVSEETYNKLNPKDGVNVTDSDLKSMAPAPSGATVSAKSPGYVELEKKLGVDGAKEYAESTTNYKNARNLEQRLDVMDHDIETLGPSWMGAGANGKMAAAKTWNSFLDSVGYKGAHVDPAKVAAGEELTKETMRTGFELAKTLGPREAMQTIQNSIAAVPGIMNTYLGAKYMSATIRAGTMFDEDSHLFKTRIISGQAPTPGATQNADGGWDIKNPKTGATMTIGKNLVGADAAFSALHPPKDYAYAGVANGVIMADPQGRDDIKILLNNPTPNTIAHFDKMWGKGLGEFIASSDKASNIRSGANPAPQPAGQQ